MINKIDRLSYEIMVDMALPNADLSCMYAVSLSGRRIYLKWNQKLFNWIRNKIRGNR